MADKKISQLTAASQVNSDAVFPLSQIVSGSEATVKATVGQVGDYIADEQTHAGLNTTAKDLIGAINEIAAGGGSSVPSVAIHPGKININNGTIEADNDYYYTDLFDAPNGSFIFDLGESSNSNYIGVEMCSSNGSHVNYWSASNRFREANHAQYYSQAPKLRLSFRAIYLNDIVLMYKVGDQVYSNYDFHNFGSGGGGGSTNIPKLISAQSRNTNSIGSLSYTFTENGKFQYYAYIGKNTTITSADLSIKLNGVAINPTFYTESSLGFFYGEINVSANDVITVTNANAKSDFGMQLFVFQNADISNFNLVGYTGNDDNSFNLNTGEDFYLNVFQCGYWSGANNFSYEVGIYGNKSVVTPSGKSYYYYGLTYVITI